MFMADFRKLREFSNRNTHTCSWRSKINATFVCSMFALFFIHFVFIVVYFVHRNLVFSSDGCILLGLANVCASYCIMWCLVFDFFCFALRLKWNFLVRSTIDIGLNASRSPNRTNYYICTIQNRQLFTRYPVRGRESKKQHRKKRVEIKPNVYDNNKEMKSSSRM